MSDGDGATRRRLLAAAAGAGLTGLAGCGSRGGDGRRGTFDVPTTSGGDRVPPGEPPLPDGARRSVDRPFGPERRYVLFGGPFATTPEGTRLSAGFTDPPDGESPARVAVAVTNATDEPAPLQFGPTPPFSSYWARPTDDPETGERRSLLVPVEDSPYGDLVPAEPQSPRLGWVATDTLGAPERPVERRRVTLEPGESVAREYHLLRHPDAGIAPAGAVRFHADWSAAALGLGVFDPTLVEDGGSRFDRSVPDLPAGTTRWFHDGPSPVRLRPSSERLTLPRDRAEFRLTNHSLAVVSATRWRLQKLVGGRWRRVAPWGLSLEGRAGPVPPGDTARFGVTVDARAQEDSLPSSRGSPFVLGPGLYALRYGSRAGPRPRSVTPLGVDRTDDGRRSTVSTTGGTGRDAPGQQTVGAVYGALFTVRGDRPPLVPTGGVETAERDGGTVTVEVDPVRRTDAPEPDSTPLVVERTTVEEVTRVLLEQAYRFPALRNALSTFSGTVDGVDPAGVERVRVLTTARRARAPVEDLIGREYLRVKRGVLSFSFGGEGYAARVEPD